MEDKEAAGGGGREDCGTMAEDKPTRKKSPEDNLDEKQEKMKQFWEGMGSHGEKARPTCQSETWNTAAWQRGK